MIYVTPIADGFRLTLKLENVFASPQQKSLSKLFHDLRQLCAPVASSEREGSVANFQRCRHFNAASGTFSRRFRECRNLTVVQDIDPVAGQYYTAFIRCISETLSGAALLILIV